jgi:predicted PurR-regulated permease PerM
VADRSSEQQPASGAAVRKHGESQPDAQRADPTTVRPAADRDPLSELPSGAPASRRDRWRAALYITTTAVLVCLVVLAVVFEQLAATGVLLVVFLSFVLAYLIAPAVEALRRRAARARRGRPLPRDLAVLVIYGIIAAVTFPFWTLAGSRIRTATERMTVLVPQHTARFVEQLRASERWYETLRLPEAINGPVGRLTRRVTHDVEGEARALGAELTGIRRLVPWLSTVPVVAFLLLTRWRRFRRSTTRVLPTPHLQWRGDELLRNLNSLLAAYTRAQALAGVIIAALCWIGFAALGVAYPGALALAAGLLEMAPLAGPIIVAVVATAMAPGHAAPVLVFLLGLRIVQDYAIYPRLIGRATRLHPLAVVIALWAGAAFGGVVGVCLAIPVVGAVQVAWRHWREYREIERLVQVAEQDPA